MTDGARGGQHFPRRFLVDTFKPSGSYIWPFELKVGVLAYGSLIDDPSPEIGPRIASTLELGGQVRRGEHSAQIVCYGTAVKSVQPGRLSEDALPSCSSGSKYCPLRMRWANSTSARVMARAKGTELVH